MTTEPIVSEEGIPIGVRYAGAVTDADGMTALVAQIWAEDDLNPHDPGQVNLGVVEVGDSTDPEDAHVLQVVLDADDALVLAELLRKAAGWCLDDAMAQPPDVAREVARFANFLGKESNE